MVNATGAGGSIATRQVAAAALDGQMVLLFHAARFANAASGIPDPALRDFKLAAVAGTKPAMIVTKRADAPWQTLEELAEAGRAAPSA